MWLILVLLGLFFCGTPASTESGDCEGQENVPGRNQIFGNSLEIDPCAPAKVQKCLPKDPPPEVDTCKTTGSSTKFPLRLLTSEYNSTVKGIKVNMMMSIQLEFFIEAHAADAKGNYDPKSDKVGFFEDLVFDDCNSYACCSTKHKSRKNVARRCPTASSDAPSALPGSSGFYSIAYLWHPPHRVYHENIIFVGTYVQSESTHWANIKTPIVRVDTDDKAKAAPTSTKSEDPAPKSPEPKKPNPASGGKKEKGSGEETRKNPKPLFSSGGQAAEDEEENREVGSDEKPKTSVFSKVTKMESNSNSKPLFSSTKTSSSSSSAKAKPKLFGSSSSANKQSTRNEEDAQEEAERLAAETEDANSERADNAEEEVPRVKPKYVEPKRKSPGIVVLKEIVQLLIPV